MFDSASFDTRSFSPVSWFFGEVEETVSRETGAGSGRYKDEEIWLFIEQLKRDHKKEVVKPEPRPKELVSKKVDLYYPEVDALLLDIEVARAVGSPSRNILNMVEKLDRAIEEIQQEEDELVELITILH